MRAYPALSNIKALEPRKPSQVGETLLIISESIALHLYYPCRLWLNQI
jgi:hypothetical protein